jgi:pimeloyl-ACP methyl ester carboxylesterase
MARTSGDISDKLSDVSAPALVVMGSKDPDFEDPAEEGAWIAEQIHGKSLVIDGAGHYPHAEMPEQVGPAIVRFLNDSSVGHAT